YAILQRHGIETAQAIHEISLSYATAAQAKQLEVSAGDALLQLREVIYDQHQRPLHTSRQFIRADRFTFRI
ncbi:MAG: UTRA domain-containing protein, partial [Aristaeellaceae bacterium]